MTFGEFGFLVLCVEIMFVHVSFIVSQFENNANGETKAEDPAGG